MLVIKISKISLVKDVQNQVSFLFCKNLSFPFLVATLEFWKRNSMGSMSLSLVWGPFFNKG